MTGRVFQREQARVTPRGTRCGSRSRTCAGALGTGRWDGSHARIHKALGAQGMHAGKAGRDALGCFSNTDF